MGWRELLLIAAVAAPLVGWWMRGSPYGIDRDRAAEQSRNLAGFDQVVRAAANGGDLSLRFAHFDASRARDKALAGQFYFRAAYALGGRKILVARGDKPIRYGQEILEAASADAGDTSPGIATLTIGMEPDGSISFTPKPAR